MRRWSAAKLIGAAGAILAGGPAPAQETPPSSEPPALGCADRPRLEAERDAIKAEITRVAMAGSDRRARRRGAAAGKMAAGTAAGLLLPFGLGLALKGTTMLAEAADKQARAKRPPPPAPPEPDIPALIEREHQLDLEIAALAGNGCAAPAPPARSKRG
jgi:hypothetical protein